MGRGGRYGKERFCGENSCNLIGSKLYNQYTVASSHSNPEKGEEWPEGLCQQCRPASAFSFALQLATFNMSDKKRTMFF